MNGRAPLELLADTLAAAVALSPQDRAALLELPVTLREVDSATYLVREGDTSLPCAILVDGFAFRHKMTRDGARQIVSLHIPGDALDLQHLYLDVADHNLQTLGRATVATVPRTALRALAHERPDIARAIAVCVAVEASIFREWILNVGRRSGRARIAHLLCEWATRLERRGLGDDQGYTLPITQEQLGDAVGMTAVHVNRMLRELQRDGLITRSKRFVEITDLKRLQEAGDFTTRYLHLALGRG